MKCKDYPDYPACAGCSPNGLIVSYLCPYTMSIYGCYLEKMFNMIHACIKQNRFCDLIKCDGRNVAIDFVVDKKFPEYKSQLEKMRILL